MSKNTYKKSKKSNETSIKFDFFEDRRFHLFMGFGFLVTSIFLIFSFLSYLKHGPADQSVAESFMDTRISISGSEVKNIFGLLGAVVAHYFIFQWFGVASFLIPPFFFIVSVRIIWGKELLPIAKSFSFSIFFILWLSMSLGDVLYATEEDGFLSFLVGGIGYELTLMAVDLMGRGVPLFLLFAFIVFTVYFFNITKLPLLSKGFKIISNGFKNIKVDWVKKKKEMEEEEKMEEEEISSVVEKIKQELEEEEKEDETATWTIKEVTEVKKTPVSHSPEFTVNVPQKDEQILEVKNNDPKPAENNHKEKASTPISMEVEQHVSTEKNTEHVVNYDPTLDLAHYKFPIPSLLIQHPPKDIQVSKDELEQNKDKILDTLTNFKISISSIKATVGPTVTLYEIVPAAGIKISKIKNLEDDIALSLAALGIRIIAPIPGKGTIGIEVPNKNPEMVDIRSVITTSKFMESKMELPIVFGKTIANEIFVTDLAKMPHLLMAGATGQGKSVGLNVILASLLYKKHPSQLKLVLVDPKKVELTLFNKIESHFLAKLPNQEDAIITDTKKVVYTLNSLCIEMDQRYDLLKIAGCRNLKEYNQKFVSRRLNPNKGHHFLPYIVLVIDELADLMMTSGKEIETPIARLAQLARAIGIHLIVATQRPSVNVITGIIKANFPARLSFRVTSKIDSRTILDTGGADQLIGMGDMLLSLGSEIIRLQCAFVDTIEIEQICDFISAQVGFETPFFLPEYEGEEDNRFEEDLSTRDALFADAARLIVTHQQGSASLIQRKMQLGYNRAGRLIDQLEVAGIVGASQGSKAREVLIQDGHTLEQLLSDIENKYKS